MIRSLMLAALLAFTGAATLVDAGTAFNECKLTGATDGGGDPWAPPCVDTRVDNVAVQAAEDAACSANPSAFPLPSPVSKGTCSRYYVLLLPDRDGDLSQINLDYRMVWEETNGCSGLQRIRWPQCNGADTPVL